MSSIRSPSIRSTHFHLYLYPHNRLRIFSWSAPALILSTAKWARFWLNVSQRIRCLGISAASSNLFTEHHSHGDRKFVPISTLFDPLLLDPSRILLSSVLHASFSSLENVHNLPIRHVASISPTSTIHILCMSALACPR